MPTQSVYLGLGSNLGDSCAQLDSALQHLAEHPQLRLIASSSYYSSAPMGPQNQPDYVNAVCHISTDVTPFDLLAITQNIENKQGRERIGDRWGPRTLDIDILLFGQLRLNTEELTIPHYGMKSREFVLVPLFEIFPDAVMLDGSTLASWVAKCTLDGLHRIQKAPSNIGYSINKESLE